jgi:NAD(P)-dependent dehydrogenase (short-subunit alcohol dehydrogenase family)
MLMKDKVCVVTGAASSHGIGRATADMLAANGAQVVVLDVSDNVDHAVREISVDHRSLASNAMSPLLRPVRKRRRRSCAPSLESTR